MVCFAKYFNRERVFVPPPISCTWASVRIYGVLPRPDPGKE